MMEYRDINSVLCRGPTERYEGSAASGGGVLEIEVGTGLSFDN
jgi:hypothetical protein